MAKIANIKDNGEVVYPITKPECVVDENGKTIKEIVQGVQGVIRQTQTWTQSAGNRPEYVMYDIVRGNIPQDNIDLFKSAGAVFNEESGYFELNGLTDISYEEMLNIYTFGKIPNSPFLQGYNLNGKIRTILPIFVSIHSSQNMESCFQYDARLESVVFQSGASPINAGGLADNARYCSTLIIPDFSRGVAFWTRMPQLVTCEIGRITANVELKQSPYLSNASVLYMVANSAATSAIVITLHADAYARAMADAEILAALEAHPNVSLASA